MAVRCCSCPAFAAKPSPARERSFSYQRNYGSGLGQDLDCERLSNPAYDKQQILLCQKLGEHIQLRDRPFYIF